MFEIKDELKRATVYLYGTIGEDYWSDDDDNTAKAFAKTLDDLSPKPLDIRIDSTGGDVYEGFAIASAIQRYEGDTVVYIDGLAASAASYIAVMGDKVVMNDYAQFMIHDAWTISRGNASDMMDTAARLDALDGTIAGIIADRTGMDVSDVRAAMDRETWYTAEEAVEVGLADEVIETNQRMAASIDMRIAKNFNSIPEALNADSSESQPGDNIEEAKHGLLVLGDKVYFEEGN